LRLRPDGLALRALSHRERAISCLIAVQ